MTTPDPDIFRQAVREHLEATNTTIQELARAADFDRSKLSKWLGGKGSINTDTASRIARVLKIRFRAPRRR